MKKARVHPMIHRTSNVDKGDEENEGADKEHKTFKVFERKLPPIRNMVDNWRKSGEQPNESTQGGDTKNDECTTNLEEIRQKAVRNWRKLRNTMRVRAVLKKPYELINETLLKGKKGSRRWGELFAPTDCLLEPSTDTSATNGLYHDDRRKAAGERFRKHRSSTKNRHASKILLKYFINLAENTDDEVTAVDFGFLESLFESGVDVNTTDKHGQCIMHEVARVWNTDIAQFLLDHGSVLNHPDDYGRTPLHVACAVDYDEMVEFLLTRGADINSRTYGEEQTPIHYAAKTDSVKALKVLLKYGADINDVDYKNRSPLQLAAELDRSETARLLVDEGAPCGEYDDSKMAAMTLMISKMPSVALLALDQFHSKNRANRQQYFYLNFLVPPTEDKDCWAKTPLAVAVENNQFQVLMHPVFQRLISVKWTLMGRRGAWLQATTNFMFCILWTCFFCSMPIEAEDHYTSSMKSIAEMVLEIISWITYFIWVAREIWEYHVAARKKKSFVAWREQQLERDLQYAHPRWPEERAYIERELQEVHSSHSTYARNYWNYFDWATYIMLALFGVAHILHAAVGNKFKDTSRSLASVALIFVWLRMLQYARPFNTLGPFVVMVGHVAADVVKIVFLLSQFYVPYLAAFWIMFGVYSIDGYTWKNGELPYNLFQMIVVGDYNLEKLVAHSPLMARLLTGTFIFAAGIICLNLFIALMADTFQRVYDNAKANAVMQRAATIIGLEAGMTPAKLQRHRMWMNSNCAPESVFYDDDTTEHEGQVLQRMTFQIKDTADQILSFLEEALGKQSGRNDSDTGFRRSPKISVDNLSHAISLNKSQARLQRTSTHSLNQQQSTTASLNNQPNVESLHQEVSELSRQFHTFKKEYHMSQIKARTEIAGLGLMLRDLIDLQTSRKRRKMQKSDPPQESPKGPEVQRPTTLAVEPIYATINKDNHHETASTQANPLQTTQSTAQSDNYPLPTIMSHASEIHQAESTLQISDSKMSSQISDQTISTNAVSDVTPSVHTSDTLPATNEGFFEGYTFENHAQAKKEKWISRTWHSIFSNMIEKIGEDSEIVDIANNNNAHEMPQGTVLEHVSVPTIPEKRDESLCNDQRQPESPLPVVRVSPRLIPTSNIKQDSEA